MVTNTERLQDPVSFPKDDSEWHSFLRNNVQDAITIREYVESLPKTAATFTLKGVDIDSTGANIPDGVVKLTGAWKYPKLLDDTQGAQKWVKPNYVHAYHFSDAIVECPCGIHVLREKFSENEEQPAYHQDHHDHCNKINRVETRLQLLKNRKEVIKDSYAHAQTLRGAVQRLGYSKSRQVGSKNVTNLGLDRRDLHYENRRKLAKTVMVLTRQYSPREVGKIYGVGKKAIGQILTEETESNASVMYSVRRRQNALAD